MRYTLLILLLLFTWTALFSQKNNRSGKQLPWSDTTFIPVVLRDTITDGKIVAVDIGKKAIIYVRLKPLLVKAKERLTNGFVRDSYNTIIHFLDTASLKGDTIFIENYLSLTYFEYLVSSQLIEGNARVFYKRYQSYVDRISHRLERYGGNADRFFKEGEKLASVRQE